MAEDKNKFDSSDLQGNLGDSPEVKLPQEEMTPARDVDGPQPEIKPSHEAELPQGTDAMKDAKDVEGINEGSPTEKAPSGEISQWEKENESVNLEEVKGFESVVEKSMDLLATKGSESADGKMKKDASVPDRIKVNGFVYKKMGTPPAKYIEFRGALYELDD